jgi:hypothetical protein
MTETARQRPVASYGADPDAVIVIPHGAIDHGPVDSGAARAERLSTGRPLVLTWGLLGPGKGIEWARCRACRISDRVTSSSARRKRWRSPSPRAMAFAALGDAEVLVVQPVHRGALDLLGAAADVIEGPAPDRSGRGPNRA